MNNACTTPAPGAGPAGRWNGCASRAVDGRRGRPDLEPFWPSRQPHLFDQTCPGSPGASRPCGR
ncbi:hypothetical protein VM98_19520 [Streptomyces rubellomurinus subsp. indigoferus]|uniref:Uncharacterized protein n=1 Tax=Streptomyces rubellomurinus (strain ATCC 31215) TaxID=359131 RepID=A0A0F2TCE2_STRR3|nr:hypothetical protein VM98_19520 [Streptomyces rubellomurinus subsp. indigoferus]KJS59402.1 hypothetical protein VM95_27290 [Streptomyces rubellomurinus]